MRRGKRNINKSKTAAAVLIIFAAAVLLALHSFEKRIDPRIREVCTYFCRSKLTEIMTGSVQKASAESKIGYSDLVIGAKSGSTPERIEINTENINKFQAMIVKQINSDIESFSDQEFDIPIGSLSDSYFFSGDGFDVKIRFVLKGGVTIKLKSEFRSAGINQTSHTITAEIHADGVMILPSGNTSISTDVTCPVCESIIVGDVPDGGMIFEQ